MMNRDNHEVMDAYGFVERAEIDSLKIARHEAMAGLVLVNVQLREAQARKRDDVVTVAAELFPERENHQ